MNYTSFIEETTENRITLVELDLGKEQIDWLNYVAGVWTAKWTTLQQVINIGDGKLGDYPLGIGEYRNFLSLGSVFVDGEEYTEKTNISDVVSSEKSWYYDNDDMRLYLHIEDNQEPQLCSIIIGVTMGLSNKAVYFNNLYYEPRIIEVPNIERTKDPLYFGIIRFDGGSITANNEDGFFDGITNNYLFGQPVRVYYGGDDLGYSDYELVYTGYLESVSMNYRTITFEVVDNRKKLSLRLPVNKYSKSVYSYLDDDDIGKAIPIAYGEVYHAEVVCVNKAQTGSPNWTFKVCDTVDHSNGIQSIDKVYVDGDEVTPVSTDLSNGTFTLSNSSWDGNKTVLVDFKGLKNSDGDYITNPLDIIEDILKVYAEVEYNSDNYNTTEWSEAKSNDLANDIGLFVNEEVEISGIIENICNSILGNFIVQDNGKYTFRILNTSADVQKTIYLEEMFEPPQIDWDGTEYLSSCKVGYKKNWGKNSYRWYNKNDLEGTIYGKYKKYISRNFETLLVNEADAQELAEAIMDYYSEVRAVYQIKTAVQIMDVDIAKIVGVEINRIGKSWLDFIKGEVIGLMKDLISGVIQITIRQIGQLVGLYYRESPYAINVNEYAINLDYYALSYDRERYNY